MWEGRGEGARMQDFLCSPFKHFYIEHSNVSLLCEQALGLWRRGLGNEEGREKERERP